MIWYPGIVELDRFGARFGVQESIHSGWPSKLYISFFLSCAGSLVLVLTLFIFKTQNYVLARTLTKRVV